MLYYHLVRTTPLKRVVRLSQILWLTLSLSVLFCACQSDISSLQNPPSPVDTALPSPESSPPPSKQEHGVLAAPVFNTSLVELQRGDTQLTPLIVDTQQRGGRYFHPAFLTNSSVAIACLRGVDLFRVIDQNSNDTESKTMSPVKRIDTPGHAWSVMPVKDHLWVADGVAGVQVVDPETGKIVAKFPHLTNARSFHQLHDGRILVCRHREGANLITSRNGTTIDLIETLPVSSRIFSATSRGKDIYLGTLGGGYIACRTDSAGTWQTVWTYTDCQRILWCHTDGQYHYLLDRDVGLRILKIITNDDSPEQIGLLKRPGQWRHGCFRDESTVLAAHQEGLLTIDISDPKSPELLSISPSPLESRGVACQSTVAVITDSEFGLRIMDVTTDTPVEMGRYGHNGLAADIAWTHHALALAQTGQGTRVFDDPAQQLTSGRRWQKGEYQTAVASGGANGNLLAIADYKGVIILENQSRKPLQQLSRIETPGRAVNVVFHGDLLLVADWFEGLQIYGVGNPAAPQHLATIPTTGWAIDAAAHGEVAYICCVNQGFVTADISNPKSPVVSHVDTSARAPEGIALGTGCLYLADFNAGLMVYDLTDPLKPEPFSCWRHTVCKGVQVKDDILILCHYIYGVKWFDISEPLKPALIGELDTWGKAYEAVFAPEPRTAYIADWHDVMKVTW